MWPGFSGTSLDVVGLVVRWVVQVSGLFDEKHFCSGYRMDSAERHGRAVRTLFDSVRCKTGMAWRRNSQFIWWPDLDGWAKNGRNLCAARRSTGKSAGKRRKEGKRIWFKGHVLLWNRWGSVQMKTSARSEMPQSLPGTLSEDKDLKHERTWATNQRLAGKKETWQSWPACFWNRASRSEVGPKQVLRVWRFPWRFDWCVTWVLVDVKTEMWSER